MPSNRGWGCAMRAKDPVVTNAVEPEAVRRYRYLLLTGEKSSLVALHASALGAMSGDERSRVLQSIQEKLVAGLRSRPDDAGGIARLAVAAEKRRAGQFRGALPSDLLEALAAAVVDAAQPTTLLQGYDDWDGVDPAAPPEPGTDRDFHTRWHDARLNPGVTYNDAIQTQPGGVAGDGYGAF